MARFAKISSDNIVIDTLTLEESYMRDENGDPQESIGQAYLETNNNWPAAQWIQDTEARKNGPGVGMEWDPSNQIFWNIQPFNSWTKNISNGKWEAPVPEPDDISEEEASNGIIHWWDEENQTWGKCNSNV
jgi:hypothetical protein